MSQLLTVFTTKYNLIGDETKQLFNIIAFSLPVDTFCVTYKQWMKKENMILASLWFGSQKQPMGTFLKPLQKTMKELYQGIECQCPEKGSFICKGSLLCGTVDVPARILLCNHMQYNRAYSCWKCEQQGISASVGRGQTRVFPFDIRTPNGPERTFNSVTENAKTAVQNQDDLPQIM